MKTAEVENYVNKFYGYGSWEQPIWFVGMEEGGCPTLQDFERRLNSWLKSGGRELIDARSHHEEMGLSKWFRERAPLQPTWARLIRIYLALHQRESDTDNVRRFQSNEFGRTDLGFASLELFSLPAINLDSWIYSEIEELPYLINRKVYQYYLYPARADYLRKRILNHKPKHVVIYGLGYRDEWEGIVRCKFKQSALAGAIETKLSSTFVLVIPHPVSRGLKQSYWTDVGNYLRSQK